MSQANDNNELETSQPLLLSTLSSLSVDGPNQLILASQSPRRREILDMMGLAGRYTVNPSPLDEESLQKELAKTVITPQDYSRTLAESKAHALAEHILKEDTLVDENSMTAHSTFILGSDTIVDYSGSILEKPKSESDAIGMLRTLSGAYHEVHTGVALYCLKSGSIELVCSFTDTAKVKFAELGESDIQAYVNTGEPMDKAGSYGIQGMGGQFVERMEGDFFTVMGLPMHRVSRELAKALS
jgi:septum formation protein